MIVVIGATGLIGSNLLYSLESKGYTNIVGIDSFGNGEKWKNIAGRSFVFFILPEQMKEFLDTHIKDITTIIHLGGISSTTEINVDEIFRTNIQLSVDLYEYCKQNCIQFIYASSAATYGLIKDDFEKFEDIADIIFLRGLRPMNAYGWSKNYIDKYISIDRSRNGQANQVVGLKFFNVYGPNEYHKGEQMSVAAKFYYQYMKYGKAKLFKYDDHGRYKALLLPKISPRRDFVYVDDCVDVIIWMMEHPEVNGLFNVGTGIATSFEMIAKIVAESIGKEPVIEYVEMPEPLQSQYQDYTCADIKKLRSVGYKAEMTSVEDGVEEYVERYLCRNMYK